jgi:transcriptional regulator
MTQRKDGVPRADLWDDGHVLDALILREKNWSMQEIAVFLGRTRNSVIGTVNRVKNETDKSEE